MFDLLNKLTAVLVPKLPQAIETLQKLKFIVLQEGGGVGEATDGASQSAADQKDQFLCHHFIVQSVGTCKSGMCIGRKFKKSP